MWSSSSPSREAFSTGRQNCPECSEAGRTRIDAATAGDVRFSTWLAIDFNSSFPQSPRWRRLYLQPDDDFWAGGGRSVAAASRRPYCGRAANIEGPRSGSKSSSYFCNFFSATRAVGTPIDRGQRSSRRSRAGRSRSRPSLAPFVAPNRRAEPKVYAIEISSAAHGYDDGGKGRHQCNRQPPTPRKTNLAHIPPQSARAASSRRNGARNPSP